MGALSQVSVPYRIVLAQLLAGAFSSLIACGFGLAHGWACALGALIVVVPNAWLAWQVSEGANSADGASQKGAGRVLGQSLTKFLITAGAAALALATLKPSMGGFFAGLVVTVLTAALVPPFLAPQQLARRPRLD